MPRGFIRNNYRGEKVIDVRTTVEVEEEVDVTAQIHLDDIWDEIEDKVLEHFTLSKTDLANLEGEDLKRHLCDICELPYTVDTTRIMETLINKL